MAEKDSFVIEGDKIKVQVDPGHMRGIEARTVRSESGTINLETTKDEHGKVSVHSSDPLGTNLKGVELTSGMTLTIKDEKTGETVTIKG